MQVIASEDWKGMREDFRMASDMISFKGYHLEINHIYSLNNKFICDKKNYKGNTQNPNY